MNTVAVLFVCSNSVYKSIDGADAYDKDRNALNYSGRLPIVAHPPCRAWASLRHCAKPEPGEKYLAIYSIAKIRELGGVLEHPNKSTLFNFAGLPAAGSIDEYGGFTIVVDQNWWGHRAQKRTRLYICGCTPSDLPLMPLKLGRATHTVGLWSGRNKATCRPSINKREFEATPKAFAEWLVDIAQICGLQKK